MVRAEILEQILNRVVTKATAPVSHYIGEQTFHFVCVLGPLSLIESLL